jgi:hypothetical protein
MTSRWLWTALSAAGASLSLVGGCGDVESCREGDDGCLNGVPDESGNCRFGLVPDATRTLCIKATASDTCGCPSGSLCRPDKSCVNVCTPATGVPTAKPALKNCRPYMGEAPFDLAKASVALCYQARARRADACGGTFNPTTECTVELSLALAATRGAVTPEQAMSACEVARDTACTAQTCDGGAAPNCAGVICSNACRSPEYNNDGLCDDGDLSNAISAVCGWGTDCGDCGPRRGSAPPTSVQLGDPCVDALQCGSDRENIKSAIGWCVPASDNAPYRCVPDCSVKGKTCPAGYECGQLGEDPDGDGKLTAVTDDSGTTASACFPLQCGN